MPRFEVKQTGNGKLNLTAYSGLALIGQCGQAAQVEAVIDPCLPVSQGMRTSDVVKSMVGLLSLGKSDFEAMEPFREDCIDKEALGLAKVPGSVWLRQRLDGPPWGDASTSSPNRPRASRTRTPGWHAPTLLAPSWKFAPVSEWGC